MDYFAKVGAYWIEEFNVDGWRLDVANEVDKGFWRNFKKACRKANPESVLIAEIWENAEQWIFEDMFDSAMNYEFRKHVRDFVAFNKIDAQGFEARMTQMLLRYPTGMVQGQLNLLDSHDVSRFMYLLNSVDKYKLSLVLLYTCVGIPCLFYGDELGVTGCKEFEYRAPMPWDNPKINLKDFILALSELRKDETFVYGSYKTVLTSGNVYSFVRSLGDKTYQITINAGENGCEMPSGIGQHECVLTNNDSKDMLKPYAYLIERLEA